MYVSPKCSLYEGERRDDAVGRRHATPMRALHACLPHDGFLRRLTRIDKNIMGANENIMKYVSPFIAAAERAIHGLSAYRYWISPVT